MSSWEKEEIKDKPWRNVYQKQYLIYQRMEALRTHILVISLYPKQIKVRFLLNPLNLWIWRNSYSKPVMYSICGALWAERPHEPVRKGTVAR